MKNSISTPSAIVTSGLDRSALAIHGGQSSGRGHNNGRGRGRGFSKGRGGYTGGRSAGRGNQWGGRGGAATGGQRDDYVIYCHYCKEPGHMKYNCPKKQAKAAHLASQDGVASSDSLPPPLAGFDDKHLCHQFQQFQLFQQYQSTQTPSSSFSATLNQTGTSTSFLASSLSYS